MKIKYIAIITISINIFASSVFSQNQAPVVSDVQAEQRAATRLVDISYTLTDDSDSLFIAVQVSQDSGKTYGIPVYSLTGDVGYGVIPGAKAIVWDAGSDFPDEYGDSFRVKIIASDTPVGKMVFIDSVTFTMGSNEFKPEHDLLISAFYMSSTEITNIQYKLFCDATKRSYPTDSVADYFIDYPAYPVVNVTWYDAVEYCNWLSTQSGYTPCYDTNDWTCTFENDGFRLPTEAEWERAARGDSSGKDYPWGNTFSADRANYLGYDGDLDSLMANFDSDRGPMPVASLDSTGFGLYDIAGNVSEWCHDWYGSEYYDLSPNEDPTGPETGSDKVKRGGDWNNSSEYLRCFRRDAKKPDSVVRTDEIGFRIVRRK